MESKALLMQNIKSKSSLALKQHFKLMNEMVNYTDIEIENITRPILTNDKLTDEDIITYEIAGKIIYLHTFSVEKINEYFLRMISSISCFEDEVYQSLVITYCKIVIKHPRESIDNA